MTPEEHNKYISWAFLANGLFQGSILLLVFGFLITIFATLPPDGDFPAIFFTALFSVILLINLAFIAPNFVAYYGLKNRKPWARIATIMAAVLSSMNVPIGTAACVYALWFFFGEEWKALYDEAPSSRPPHSLKDATRWEGYTRDEQNEVVYRHQQPPDWR